jgi:hypothetical protein
MKRLLRPFWNLARPLRARLALALDRVVYAAADRALTAHDPRPQLLDEFRTRFDDAERRAAARAAEQAEEITLVLDAVVAEQFRLQSQLDDLRRRLDEALTAASGWD